jgi:rsbT co-antagonist protein RsbR
VSFERLAPTEVLLFTADRGGTLLELSEPLARLLGSDVGKGTKLSVRVHPEDRRAFRREWTKVAKSVEPVQFDCRLRGADGAYHSWSWRARASARSGRVKGSLQDGEATSALATRAPSELIRALPNPRAQARILSLVQESIPIAVWEIDAHGVFLHHAGKGLSIAGLAQGQWLGKNIFDIYPKETVGPVRAAIAGELQRAGTEAHGIHWDTWYIPVRDMEGRVTSVVGISLDVTEQKRAEAALRDKISLVERQAQVIRALSTPIIEVWDKVVTLPLLGVLDSVRAADVMESLLTEVSKKGARFAILDLTGIETVDTATAGHMLRMIHAIRLLGATGVISGVQPYVAQTMAALGLDLKDIPTFATLRDALRHCMVRLKEGVALRA